MDVYMHGRLLLQSYLYLNLSEGADLIGGQLHGDKECPFSSVLGVWYCSSMDGFMYESVTVFRKLLSPPDRSSMSHWFEKCQSQSLNNVLITQLT